MPDAERERLLSKHGPLPEGWKVPGQVEAAEDEPEGQGGDASGVRRAGRIFDARAEAEKW